jgi:mycoredoxin
MSEGIIVYGTTWCPDCHRAKQVLDKHKIAYTWINIEDDPAAADIVVKINKGNRSVPTILFPDGSTLVEPSNSELEKKLGY